MAATPADDFRPTPKKRSEALGAWCVLLLIVAGMLWAYWPAKEPMLPAGSQSPRIGLDETVSLTSWANAKRTGEVTHTPVVARVDPAIPPGDVPQVRLSATSDSAGYLHGTVHNDTGRPVSQLKLRVTTAKWSDRAFDVSVSVKNNATAPFSFFVGDPGIQVVVVRVLSPSQ